MRSWDSTQLFLKAKAYSDRANSFDHGEPEFPLWSALALELLARSALTKLHPVLNADPRDEGNIFFGLGLPSTTQPRSLPAHSVFLRLEKLVPGFGKAQRELCDFVTLLRNEELHSAGVPFETLKESQWLPRYYEVCTVLCTFLGSSLEGFLGGDLTKPAEGMVNSLKEEILKAVKTRIAEHSRAFSARSSEEQVALRVKTAAAATGLKSWQRKETCPACGSDGILAGDLIQELEPEYADGVLYITEEYLATGFDCAACELVLRRVEEITVAGIEPRFTGLRETSLHELYEHDFMDEYDNM